MARVKQDLALGHTYSATQRLRTLVAIDPEDLELRRMLAEIYRQTGNLVEAGRWTFVFDDATEAELAAFARANPHPWLRLRLLRWEGDDRELAPAAQARLAELRAAAAAAGPPATYRGPLRSQKRKEPGTTFPCLFVLVVLGVFGFFAAVGLYRIIAWVLS